MTALAFPADEQNILQSNDGKIVGGEGVDILDFPYQVSMQFFGSHYCGGAIVSRQHILTAAHCVDGFPASSITVRVGSTMKNEGGEVYNVSQITMHSAYNWRLLDYDCAVLTLASELTFGPGINAIAIQDDVKITEGSPAFVTGWGALSEGGSSSPKLQGVQVYYIDSSICQDAYRDINNAVVTGRMLCAGYKDGGRDACQGNRICLVLAGISLILFYFYYR